MHPGDLFDDVWVGAMAGEARQPTQLLKKVGCADLTAVPEVRHALRKMLGKWGGPGASDVAELLTSELVTNALIHTDHGAVVTATVVPDSLRVEVRDFVPGLPEPDVPFADDGTHGRGLVLVEALADSWGVEDHGVGKVVWFELNGGAA
ncbi:ATP-binding protein [Streptomyces sp. ISL-36]|uniref:ATP-binding protein n=1 Tax=Streptomyces sp. ISL-36 TaxID=2819182 RepID=UPI0020362460|nr:ATP-binding protein [Streptomyces sp. ISL-36]